MRINFHQPALFVHHVPPSIEDVKGYFTEKGAPHREAEDFYHVYEKRHWTSRKGNFIINWKTVAFRWISSILQPPHQSLHQPKS
ncbi:hypothetical protein [Puia dinghuensis]|uniref:hypothetical protein n=1 Tax=Puia dinghuensis TaxID=1792502 RepID=UPI0016654949|nr:hypothetical protein [Puia dinghuensis]